MINGRNFFDQPVKNFASTYGNTRNIATDQETTIQLAVCLIMHA